MRSFLLRSLLSCCCSTMFIFITLAHILHRYRRCFSFDCHRRSEFIGCHRRSEFIGCNAWQSTATAPYVFNHDIDLIFLSIYSSRASCVSSLASYPILTANFENVHTLFHAGVTRLQSYMYILSAKYTSVTRFSKYTISFPIDVILQLGLHFSRVMDFASVFISESL